MAFAALKKKHAKKAGCISVELQSERLTLPRNHDRFSRGKHTKKRKENIKTLNEEHFASLSDVYKSLIARITLKLHSLIFALKEMPLSRLRSTKTNIVNLQRLRR